MLLQVQVLRREVVLIRLTIDFSRNIQFMIFVIEGFPPKETSSQETHADCLCQSQIPYSHSFFRKNCILSQSILHVPCRFICTMPGSFSSHSAALGPKVTPRIKMQSIKSNYTRQIRTRLLPNRIAHLQKLQNSIVVQVWSIFAVSLVPAVLTSR